MKNHKYGIFFINILLIFLLTFIISCSNNQHNSKAALEWAKNKANFIGYDFKSLAVEAPGIHAIANFEFMFTQITDKDLKELAKLNPELYRIRLSGSLVTDKGIESISTISMLRSLELSTLTDTGCRSISKLKNLRWLFVSKTLITDDCLYALKKMHNIITLHLDDTKINGNGFNGFKSELKILYANKTNIDDTGLRYISQFKNLELLHLSGTNLTNRNLTYLIKLTQLINLNIGNTEVTDSGITALLPMSGQLTDLQLDNLALTDVVIKTLTSFKSLKQLYLFGTKLTPQGISQLREALPETEIHY